MGDGGILRAARAHVLALVEALSGLVLLGGRAPGAIALVALALKPTLLGAGVAAWLGATACAALIGAATPLLGPAALNPLLAGLVVGWLVAPGVAALAIAAPIGAAALIAHLACAHALRAARAPAFSLPYVLVAGALWQAMPRYPGLAPALAHARGLPDCDLGLPTWASGALRAFGALVWMPHPLAGLALVLAVAWRSRLQCALAGIGIATAALARCAAGRPWAEAWAAADGYDPLLAAMAIGGALLAPSWRALALAIVASLATALVGDALACAPWWGGAGLPAFTLPFVLVCAPLVAVLAAQGGGLLAPRPGATPEETLVEHACWRARFPGTLRAIAPPCAGAWTVWQGEDGPWTHRGAWRHALDLVIAGADGRTHRSHGARLEDYLAFGEPVLSPIAGQVVAALDGLPDNGPGEPDAANRWGNHVILRDARGFHVELSHLQRGSLAVAIGQWVERGQPLGRCGNSGYSPQPHIHLQVQDAAHAGAPTLPFSLASWWDGARYRANDLPRVGESVDALAPDPERIACVRLLLGDELSFRVERDGVAVGRVAWRVAQAADGGTMLVGERGRLHVGVHEGTFYAYRLDGDDPWLRRLFACAARLPLARRDELAWSDAVPVTIAERRWRAALRSACAFVLPRLAVARTRHRWRGGAVASEIVGDGLVRARRLALTLDPARGVVALRDGRWSLVREDAAVVVEPAAARAA